MKYWSIIRKKLANIIYPEYKNEVNLRVAEIMNKTDPFDPVLKLFHGIFSEEFERPEDSLDKRSQLNMEMFANRTVKDPSFKYLTDWVMNVAGNECLKRAPISAERTQYARAQIANMLLFKRELERLSNLYEEMLKPEQEFDKNVTIEL